ncbi:MAG: AhpC/TSA family protein [Bacteroidales bacterium]|nr:AhpC/TSA family protein [Bacteroidales bacterium]
MKKILYLILPAFLLVNCTSKPHYEITGNIKGADSVKFLLQKRDGNSLVTIDSAFSKNGTFKMKGGPVDYPEMVMLVASDNRMRTSFYLENSKISITGTLDSLYNAVITGSKTQDEYQNYINSAREISDRYNDVVTQYQIARQNEDEEKINELTRQADEIQKEYVQYQKDFIKNNPSSFVSPSLLRGIAYEMEPDEIESYLNMMDSTVARIPAVSELKEMVVKMKSVAIGQKAPDFTLNDADGNPVSLSSKVGSKLLLVDFWAAWCGPCRQENPNVVKVYKEFNKKGFDIFGVSLDQNREDWLKAIKDDNLTWTHVSDLQYWNNAAARLYSVNAIPANFLLDEKGVIIAKNLRGEELYNKVKEILK